MEVPVDVQTKRRVKVTISDDNVEWVIIKFLADSIVSVLKLQEVFTEDGAENGVDGDLQEGEKCLAPYDKKLYEAKILLRTDDKEKALRDKKTFEKIRNSKDHNGNDISEKLAGGKDTLMERKQQEASRKETLNNAEDYILQNLSPIPFKCSSNTCYPNHFNNTEISTTMTQAPLLPLSTSSNTSYPNHFNNTEISKIMTQGPLLPLSTCTPSPTLTYTSTCTSSDSFSNLMTSSLSVLNGEEACPSCLIKDSELNNIKVTLSQFKEDNRRLKQRITELETLSQQRADNVSVSFSGAKSLVNHYVPSKGVKVDYSDYKVIAMGQDVPEGYERLSEASDVCVPRSWIISILGLSKGKPPSYCLKKMIDGFFEPEDFTDKSASKILSTSVVMKGLRLYAINKLKMKDSEFMAALNSKVGTMRRCIKKERRTL